MTRLLYPFISSALITIVPFLLTFENGQDVVRGLVGYEYFAILLFIIFVKDKLKKSDSSGLTRVYVAILVTLIVSLFFVAWIDLQNLLAIKDWKLGWYGLLPFVTCSVAVVMVWKTKPFSFNIICVILFVLLIAHLLAFNHYAAQPLAQFPTIDYLDRMAPTPIQRKEISAEFRKKYFVKDSVTITRDYVDTSRNNVIVLVESWGVPLDLLRFDEQLDVFKGFAKTIGVHNRVYSRTRTAEREDLIKVISRDTLTKKRDTTFLPKVFSDINYRTTFLFGGDSLEQFRYKYISNMGFNHAIFANELNDSAMVLKIDSLLDDTTQKHFIAWTTRDTKFPLPGISNIYNSDVETVDSVYTMRLNVTLLLIVNLAHKHPETHFIIQGDHNPILSPIHFQERFYKRWVPFVVLN
jgi:hypothetical protein